MLKSTTYKEHSMKWQPRAATNPCVVTLDATVSAINMFGGRLGQEASIDSRQDNH